MTPLETFEQQNPGYMAGVIAQFLLFMLFVSIVAFIVVKIRERK